MDDLEQLVAAELAIPADPRVSKLAAAIAARHGGARGVLFYGSCLREKQPFAERPALRRGAAADGD